MPDITLNDLRHIIENQGALIGKLDRENARLRAALESIRLHADGQVSQYARARELVLGIALTALALGEEDGDS